ncbi:transcription factor [Ganoderma sinense ZZ0214-1]|uniref:Transcription factor n=1 Tax=Ganoderma sinense ZZ0214-1 TaxID=1077348 RepID=A0A2G8SSS8_9APHY|nr:transcription factor [Ganoderma sinense ZZ0214-1]
MYAGPSKNPGDLVQPAVQANKEHQYALKVYTERLEAELEHLDKLLAATEVSDDDEEEVPVVNSGGTVFIPGAAKPRSLIPLSLLTDEDSPFYPDAVRRHRYESFTESHPMKAQELEALADAVRSENYRLHALEAQARGLPPFMSMGEPPPDFNMNKEGIDWERVAQKACLVSSASTTVQRTAKECEIRWLGERHPQFNDTQWTKSEIAKVKELVGGAREGEVDWVEIAEKLGTGRTPVDCMRNAITRRTHTWTPDADRRLLTAIDMYGTDNWHLVARAVSEDATTSQCQSRYLRSLDPTLKRGPWTPEEDEHLRRAAAVFGHSWVDVAAFVEGRNNEQCRERYQEYLNPSITKGKWSKDQDSALLKAVEQVGEGKWKEVSRVLNIGRTDNMCRLRYGVLTKRNMSVTPSPAPAPAPAPSESAGVAPPRRSTPAGTRGGSQILILHAESYYSRSSTSTPAPALPPVPASSSSVDASTFTPTPAPESAPQPKPKPRPRARRKQPTPDVVSGATSEQGIAGPSTLTLQEQPTLQTFEEIGESTPVEVVSKGSASSAREEKARPRKRQRTAEASSVPAMPPAAATITEQSTGDIVMEDIQPPAEDPQPEGRGGEDGAGSDVTVNVSIFQPEPGPPAGPPAKRSVTSAPTRRQPPRAANKASRPETQDVDAS